MFSKKKTFLYCNRLYVVMQCGRWVESSRVRCGFVKHLKQQNTTSYSSFTCIHTHILVYTDTHVFL